jgi:hypothetical protein
MKKYAIIDKTTGFVDNVILWDGIVDWEPPEGYQAMHIENEAIGPNWTYLNGTFTEPVIERVPEPEIILPTKEEILAQIAELTAKINALG